MLSCKNKQQKKESDLEGGKRQLLLIFFIADKAGIFCRNNLTNHSGAIVEQSRACVLVCSGFVVVVLGSNPTWEFFFLNKKKIIFQELDGELS